MAAEDRGSDMATPLRDIGSGGQLLDVSLRIGVKALISQDSQVLLIRERHRNGDPFWTLPGGGIHSGESIRQALTRELTEEIDCEPSVGEVVDTCLYRHRSVPNLVSLYVVITSQIESSPEPNSHEWVFESTLADPTAPPDSLLLPFCALLEDLAESDMDGIGMTPGV